MERVTQEQIAAAKTKAAQAEIVYREACQRTESRKRALERMLHGPGVVPGIVETYGLSVRNYCNAELAMEAALKEYHSLLKQQREQNNE